MKIVTIEIDDAGTGDLIGDAYVLFWRRETNTLLKKIIPLELYQQSDFNKLTQQHVIGLFKEAFSELNVPKTEEILVCSGNVFDQARKFMEEEKYNFKTAKIEGYLQDQVEAAYLTNIIEEYNFPSKILNVESGRKRFFSVFHWIAKDFPRRSIYVKTGFSKWNTKLAKDAQGEWMKKMVTITDSPEANESNKRRKPKKRTGKKATKKKQSRPAKRSSTRRPASRNPNANRNKGRRPGNYRKRPSGNHRESSDGRDENQRYSSTDPNPMKKFY